MPAAVPAILIMINAVFYNCNHPVEIFEYRIFKTVNPYGFGTGGWLAQLAWGPVVEGVEHHALRVRRSTIFLTAA